MKHSAIRKRFEQHLRSKSLKFTSQRDRIFELAFNTHQHFTADTLHEWLKGQEGAPVSRATVYRTLHLLVEGGFIASLDAGRGELVYEHVLGHAHHDHLVCLDCGKIEEFRESGSKRVIRAAVPLARMFGYMTDLRSLSEGRGTFSMQFLRYDVAGS